MTRWSELRRQASLERSRAAGRMALASGERWTLRSAPLLLTLASGGAVALTWLWPLFTVRLPDHPAHLSVHVGPIDAHAMWPLVLYTSSAQGPLLLGGLIWAASLLRLSYLSQPPTYRPDSLRRAAQRVAAGATLGLGLAAWLSAHQGAALLAALALREQLSPDPRPQVAPAAGLLPLALAVLLLGPMLVSDRAGRLAPRPKPTKPLGR